MRTWLVGLRMLLAGWLLAAAPAVTADVLRLTDAAGRTRDISIDVLDAELGVEERTIAHDFLYRTARRYRGYDLARLLTHFGLPLRATYQLVCADGYVETLDARLLESSGARGFLARADTAAPAGAAWAEYRIGDRPIRLAPFYLTWTPSDAGTDPRTLLDHPWPYALVEIRALDPARQYAAAAPAADAPLPVQQGFQVYKTQCGKCHAVRHAGGRLGPDLSTSAMVRQLPDDHLADVITRIDRYFPDSKMPVFAGRLETADVSRLMRYLRHVSTPPP